MEEVQYLQSLYSKLSIHAGRHQMRPNIGVFQGLIISPALFNIYLEPLLNLLTEREGLPMEDVLAYADDLLISTTGRSKVQDLIRILEEFSAENGLIINKTKSAIVEFTGRHDKTYLRSAEVLGFPVLMEYRYLGLG